MSSKRYISIHVWFLDYDNNSITGLIVATNWAGLVTTSNISAYYLLGE